MKIISVLIDYATISPAVLENVVFNNLLGFCFWHEFDEDTFEFVVQCRQEDAVWVEKRLALYV